MDKKAIGLNTVASIAKLSRLSLSNEDMKLFAGQMADILGYVDKLNELDTEGVPPTSHALSELKDVFREDVVRVSLTQDQVLKNAPKRINDFFAVPKIIE